jgi:hypothetical protein
MKILTCRYEPPHTHEYPDDWQFDGANGLDPRADPRYRGSTYFYYDADLTLLEVTQVPLCDDQALDEFTKVAGYGPRFNPRYIQVKRPGESKPSPMPWNYYKETDEVVPA